jgi:hypothetical protein
MPSFGDVLVEAKLYKVSQDPDYVYDVYDPDTCSTALSRRHEVRDYAQKVGKKIAPLSATGRFCASDYDKLWKEIKLEHGKNVWWRKDTKLQKCSFVPVEKQMTEKVYGFVYGDVSGERVSPLESEGSIHEFPATAWPCTAEIVRFPDMIKFIFSTRKLLLQHLHYIISMISVKIPSSIYVPEEGNGSVVLDQVISTMDGKEFSMPGTELATNQSYSKGDREKLRSYVEWHGDVPIRDICKAVPKRILPGYLILREHPYVLIYYCKKENELRARWTRNVPLFWNVLSGGVGAYKDFMSFKSDVMSRRIVSFTDDIVLDISLLKSYSKPHGIVVVAELLSPDAQSVTRSFAVR